MCCIDVVPLINKKKRRESWKAVVVPVDIFLVSRSIN